MRYKAIIYDFDGTLINSTEISMQHIFQGAAQDAGLNIPSIELLTEFWGKPIEEEIKIMSARLGWPNGSGQHFIHHLTEREKTVKYKAIPGLNKLLQTIQENNIYQAILSNRQAVSEKIMNQVGIKKYWFHTIQSYKKFAKPDPRVFDPIIFKFNKFGIQSEDIIYIGDLINYDYKSCVNHNPPISFIGITSMLHSRNDFLDEGISNEFIVDSILDIEKIILNNT